MSKDQIEEAQPGDIIHFASQAHRSILVELIKEKGVVTKVRTIDGNGDLQEISEITHPLSGVVNWLQVLAPSAARRGGVGPEP